MLRRLFEQVRENGKIDLNDSISIKDILPIIYTGESNSDSGTTYYNSGGRSILFQKGGQTYRIKGVDPFGYLTERIATSKKNKISNVKDTHNIINEQLSQGIKRENLEFNDVKPFGTFFFDQAECEIKALEKLKLAYERLGIENPCEPLFYKDTNIEKNGRKTYQTAFKLPNLETDVRTHEFMSLLTERLDSCSPSEIAAKDKNIARLFGRFIYWAGINAGLFASVGVLPIDSSFYPQNWIISRYKEGYGIFRVDHTSTKLTDPHSVIRELTKEKHGLSFILNEFSVFPSRVKVAAEPTQFLPKNKKNLKFSQILNSKKDIYVDESKIIEAHKNVFKMGLFSLLQGQIAPIHEEMFLEALE